MNAQQEIKLTMEMAVRDCINNNATITATIPGFSNFFPSFTANITQIQNISEQQGFSKKGISGNKKQLKAVLVVQAADIARKVAAFALNTNNAVLGSEVHFTESDLKNMSGSQLRDSSQRIYDRANSNVAALATYSVTAAILTAFQTAINNFNAAIPKPKIGAAERKQLTAQLKSLFAANDSLLASMDKLIEVIRISQPVFYGNYKNNRKLTDVGSHKLVLKIKVIDASNNNPVKNTEFKFVQVSSDNKMISLPEIKPILKKTATHGGINMKHLPEGVYQVTVSKKGYKTQNLTINITHGETTNVNVVIEKA